MADVDKPTTRKLTRDEIVRIAGAANFKLDEDLLEQIVKYVSIGNYINVSCAAVGITHNTYNSWQLRGRKVANDLEQLIGDDADLTSILDNYDNAVALLPELHHNDWMCLRFLVATNKATAEAEVYAVGIVRKHMPDQWTAAMTFLERKAPDRWKRREQLDVAAQTQGGELSDEDKALLEPEAQRHLGAALKAAQRQLEAGE